MAFFLGDQLDLHHSVAPLSAKQPSLASVMQLLNQVMVVSEAFYFTVHVFSFIDAVLQHPYFHLLNKIIELFFFSVFQV